VKFPNIWANAALDSRPKVDKPIKRQSADFPTTHLNRFKQENFNILDNFELVVISLGFLSTNAYLINEFLHDRVKKCFFFKK